MRGIREPSYSKILVIHSRLDLIPEHRATEALSWFLGTVTKFVQEVLRTIIEEGGGKSIKPKYDLLIMLENELA